MAMTQKTRMTILEMLVWVFIIAAMIQAIHMGYCYHHWWGAIVLGAGLLFVLFAPKIKNKIREMKNARKQG